MAISKGEDLRIEGRDDLEEWLSDKPLAWAQAIAVRTALRVAPLAWNAATSPDAAFDEKLRLQLILFTFRAAFLASVAGKYPSEDIRDATYGAAHEADRVASFAKRSAGAASAVSAADATAFTARATLSAARAVSDAADAAAHAARATATDAATIWNSVSSDAQTLISISNLDREIVFDEGDEADHKSDAQLLLDEPLWPDAKMPDWAFEAFERFSTSELAQSSSFRLIAEWYGALLPSAGQTRVASLFGVELDIEIASQPDKFWEQDPTAVMDAIAEMFGKWSPSPSPSPSPQPAGSMIIQSELPSDTPDRRVDALGRSEIAFMLAGKLNRVWNQANGPAAQKPSVPAEEGHMAGHAPPPKDWDATLQPGYVVHVDAPWGGGKTSFANYLKTVLNPYRDAPGPQGHPEWLMKLPLNNTNYWPEAFHKPWILVDFNAWKHQEINPPWWVFYETIRQESFEAILHERRQSDPDIAPKLKRPYFYGDRFLQFLKWFELWLSEKIWRINTPVLQNWLITAFAAFAIAAGLQWFGIVDFKNLKFSTMDNLGGTIGKILAILIGGGGIAWKIADALFKSLLPGTPDAAKNYSLGSGDPLARFRKHFARMMKSLDRPVLVVVDDLDRCKPEFVVELVRGMQTILVSPHVIFVLLCDRDWIEKSFAEINKAMVDIDVGPEHSFGGRFVEKAIQLSLILPEPRDARKKDYLEWVLTGTQPGASASADGQPEPPDEERAQVNNLLQEIETFMAEPDFARRNENLESFRANVGSRGLSDAVVANVTQESKHREALRTAADGGAEDVTGHLLLGLVDHLPDNPRQLKRIIATITMVQELARIREKDFNEERWQKLARWVVIMSEFPQSWFTMSTHPQVLDHLNSTGYKENDIGKWAKKIRENKPLMGILDLQDAGVGWHHNQIRREDIDWLVKVMPPTSGRLLELAKESPKKD